MSKAYREVTSGGESEPTGGASAGKRTRTQGLIAKKAARDGNGVAAGAGAAVDQAAGSSGSPLPADVRDRFESSLGTDLSAVRVHTGAASSESSEAVGAKAYTLGNDIHFGAGQYQPDDPFGMHLLAHEVAHTQQQVGGEAYRQNQLEVSTPDDPAEHEADRAADAMVAGRPVTVSAGGASVARKIFRKTKAEALAEASALASAESLASAVGGGGGPSEPSPWGGPIAEPSPMFGGGGSAADDYVGSGAPLAGAPEGPGYTPPPAEGTGFALPPGHVAVPKKSTGGAAPSPGSTGPAPSGGGGGAAGPTDFSSIGPVQNPDAGLVEPESGPALKKLPVGGKIRYSHTFKTKLKPPRDFKYASIDAAWVKVDVEIAAPGSLMTVTPSHSKGETGDGKTKTTQQKELTVSPDALKLKFDDGAGKISPKAGWEESSEKKVLSMGVDVQWGSALGEVKIELWGTDKGEHITPRIVPGFGGVIDQKIDVEGYEVSIKGKLLVGCDVKPNYAAILQALGRGASTAGGAGVGAAGVAATEVIPTGLGAVGGGTILFAAGMLAIPATTLLALYKGAKDVKEMKGLGAKAEGAAGDFIGGYCSAFGVGSSNGSGFAKAGADLGSRKLDVHVKRMEQAYDLIRQKNPEIGELTDADRATLRDHAKRKVQAAAASFREQTKQAFYWWIQGEIFRAWQQEAKAENRWFFDKHEADVKTYVLGSHHAPLEPDWGAFENGPLPP